MRLIDADAMLAELKPVEFEDGYKSMPIADVSKIMRDWVSRQPTITQSGWVSVEDRLPAENESVLCITNGKPRENITLIATYQIGSWNTTEGWIIDEWPDWEDAEVLWWMPLPEPPKED